MPPQPLKEHFASSLHKNIKKHSCLTETKNLSRENCDHQPNKPSSSIVSSINKDVGRGVALNDSVAPTLPIHSPHSPLLADESPYHQLRETQLSARYINNTKYSHNAKQSAVNDYIKSDTISSSPTQVSSSTTLSCNLLCYCLKCKTKSIDHSYDTIADSCASKRLVPTRNASTSPNLDVRKLGSMNTLAPSPSLSNEICIKTIECKINKFKKFGKNNITYDDEGRDKETEEKNKSLNEYKTLKIIRSARSLSPRPHIRHQHDKLVPNPRDISINVLNLCNENNRINKNQINKLCLSEQSSPNITDAAAIQFSYRESTNRSTSCLGNSNADPWLKSISFGIKSSTVTLTTNEENELSSTNTKLKNIKDPWIKMPDVEIARHDLFRKTKSFSESKFDIESMITNPPLVNETKSSGHLNAFKKANAIIKHTNRLQSAPTSPQFVTTVENNFSSPAYITSKHGTEYFAEKTPKRSSSFSPARIKDSNNPFKDYNIPRRNSPPPLISVATEIMQEQNTNNMCSANYASLNVCNTNFLTTRHSFSSIIEQKHGEELQLNIRRLSDQMRPKDSTFTNVKEKHNTKIKVSKSPADTSYPRTEGPLCSADFSEYLEQFRCSEAKKAGKENSYFWKKKLLPKTPSNQAVAINEAHQSSDRLLETTC